MTRTHAIPLFLVPFLLTGCPGGVACDLQANASVSLTLVDPDGATVSGADVSASFDGADEEPCEDMGSGAYVCGWEQAGEVDVTIRALGFAVDTLMLTVDEDTCHVITEVVEHTLTRTNCTDEALPALLVDVTDSQGADVTEATVTWTLADADAEPEDCTPLEGNRWACAEEEYGAIELRITDAGPYQPFFALLDVDHDGCHPITQTVDAVLQYLPD